MNGPIPANQQLLRWALFCNAGFSVFSAMIIVFWHNRLVQWLGIPKGFDILYLGIGLMIFAVWLVLNGARVPIKMLDARMAIAMDLAWVVLSIPVVVFAPLASQGKGAVTVVAGVVLSFAVTQWIGVRRIRGASQETIREVHRA
jgi:hypothetical protein